MRRYVLPLAICGLLGLVVASTALPAENDSPAGPDPEASLVLQGSALGTTYTVRLALVDQRPSAVEVQAEVETVLAEIDGQMSLWRPESELSRFNRSQSTDWFDVSAPTADVVWAALEIANASDGAFDPTVSPLVQLWNFGPGTGGPQVPSPEELAEVREQVGYERVAVRLSPPAIRKDRPSVALDLNAIAKGYAVDRVAERLRRLDPKGLMVEIGGEVRVEGTKVDGSRWRIGIERPVSDRRELGQVVELTDVALATSGDYRNYFEANGIRYSHTLDPRSGAPVRHSLASVSVLASDCMTADAWATALMVLGPDDGLALARERGLRACFLVRNAEGFRSLVTAGFPDLQPVAAAPPAGSPLTTFLLAAALFGLAVAGMAIGVILSNRRLQGTCGGLAGLQDGQGRSLCEACTNPSEECAEFRQRVGAPDGTSGTGTNAFTKDDA